MKTYHATWSTERPDEIPYGVSTRSQTGVEEREGIPFVVPKRTDKKIWEHNKRVKVGTPKLRLLQGGKA